MKRNHSQKRNRLQRILKVHEVHNANWEEGLSYKFIWKKFIYNQFFIEYHTYINYLGINAKKELKALEEEITAERQQEDSMKGVTTLFSIAALATIVMFSACGTPASKLASTCAELYPCRDSLTVREVTKTDTVELSDTYVMYLDTTQCPPSAEGVTLIDTDTVYLKGQKIVITRTVMDSTFWRIDQAHMASLANEITSLEQQRDDLTAKLAACNAVVGKDSGLPWWWLLIVSAGSFLVARIVNRKSKEA